jgi:hypothetical protein
MPGHFSELTPGPVQLHRALGLLQNLPRLVLERPHLIADGLELGVRYHSNGLVGLLNLFGQIHELDAGREATRGVREAAGEGSVTGFRIVVAIAGHDRPGE